MWSYLKNTIKWIVKVIIFSANKFYWDDCFSRASSLAYTTLFALVPVSALSFSMLNAFRLDKEQSTQTLLTFIDQFLPPIENDQLKKLHEEMYNYLKLFIDNVSALNILSVSILFITAIALLNTIESALNTIWRVGSNIGIVSKIISFWAVMSLGPLLVTVSFFWYSRFNSLTVENPWLNNSNFFSLVGFFVPVTSIWLALTLLFYKLPSAKVKLQDAALGALFSAVTFEIVKRAFASYITLSTTYSTIYGVLTTVPIFLFWLYITWIVVLYGAEISYQAGAIKILHNISKYATDLGEIGAILGLRILYCIGKRFCDGVPAPTESEIAIETGADPVRVRTCLDILSSANLITNADTISHSRSLLVSPDKLTVAMVCKTFMSQRSSFFTKNEFKDDTFSERTFLDVIKETSDRLSKDRTIVTWNLKEILNK